MWKGTTMTTIYIFLAICVLMCHRSAGEVNEVDVDSEHDQNMFARLELFLQRKLFHILKENPALLNYAALNYPEHAEFQNSRFKRGPGIAGLENLDFMTGIFSKLPMSSNSAISDMRQLMRAAGRRRK